MARKLWGPEQDGILLRHYGKMTVAELTRKYLPGWHENTIRCHAAALDLTRKRTTDEWTPDEDAILRQWCGKISVRTIKKKYLPHRTRNEIYQRASALGLKPDGINKPWTEAEDEIIRRYYGTIPIQDLAAMLPGRTPKAIRLHVRFLGLELGHHNQIAWREYGRLTDGKTHKTSFGILKKKEPNRNNATGVRGVSFCKRESRYRATIRFQRRFFLLGRYRTLEEAAKARAEGMEKLQPILDAIKADIAGRKDELIAQAVQMATEIRQADKEISEDEPRPAETAPQGPEPPDT